MNRWIHFAGMAALTAGSLFATETEVVYQNDFNTPAALQGWKESHWHSPQEPATKRPLCSSRRYLPDGGRNGSGCIVFESDTPSCNVLTALALDVGKLKGRGVILEGWMKGENLAPPRIDYLGPKLMLTVTTPVERNHPDQRKKYGTYDWEKFYTVYRVGDSTESVFVNLGLQGCTGKIYIDDLQVRIESDAPAASAQRPAGQLQANQTTRYRGVMSGNDLSDAAFRELRDVWNANLLRFQINRKDGEDNSTREGFRKIIDRNLARLDQVLPLAKKYGIKLVIDMHIGPGTKVNGQLSNQMSYDPKMQQLFIDVWREIAHKYRGNTMIYGYDLLNEPREENYVPGSSMNWRQLAEATARAIREEDGDTPIIMEAAPWGGPSALDGFRPLNIPKVIYSIHYYRPGDYTHQGVMPGRPAGQAWPGVFMGERFDKARLEKGLQAAIDFQKKYNVPIYVGEFGVARWAPNGEQWLDDLISIMEKHGWDWTFHSFREWDGWSVEHDADPQNHTRVGDTPRRRVLLRYMARNPRAEGASALPAAPRQPDLIFEPDFTVVRTTSRQSAGHENGVPVLTLTHREPVGNWVFFPIVTAGLAGKTVLLSAEVSGREISAPPHAWEGAKVMLALAENNGRKNNVQLPLPHGSFDWKKVSVEIRIPADLKQAKLVLGLENVSGQARFRNVRITEVK